MINDGSSFFIVVTIYKVTAETKLANTEPVGRQVGR